MPRSRTFRRAALPAVALAAALALTACGGAGGTGTKAEAEAEAEETVGPLEAYLNELYESGRGSAAEAAAQAAEIEERVAACMAAAGFDYTPVPQREEDFAYLEESIGGAGAEPEVGTVAFAEQYGYGIVAFPGVDGAAAADADVEDTDVEDTEAGESEEWVDPNADYLESLSEAERTAYDAALYGEAPSEEELADEDYDPGWEDLGCTGAAQHEVGANAGDNAFLYGYEDPEFADLYAAIDRLYAGDEVGAGVAELDAEWAECIAGAGFAEYASPDEAETGLYAEYEALAMPDGEDGEWVEPGAAELEEFQRREIEVAVADATCREEVDYAGRLREQTRAREQAFVDEHRAELDALLAKHGGGSD